MVDNTRRNGRKGIQKSSLTLSISIREAPSKNSVYPESMYKGKLVIKRPATSKQIRTEIQNFR